MLPGGIQLARGIGGDQHAEAERMEKGIPEGQQVVEVQSHRNADGLFSFVRRVLPVVIQKRKLVAYKFLGALAASVRTGFEQRFPARKRLPPGKRLTVRLQWFWQP